MSTHKKNPNQASVKDVYDKIPTEEDVEMIEESAVVPEVMSKQRENKTEKKPFVPTSIRNEIDIDVSKLERSEPNESVDKEEMAEEWEMKVCPSFNLIRK